MIIMMTSIMRIMITNIMRMMITNIMRTMITMISLFDIKGRGERGGGDTIKQAKTMTAAATSKNIIRTMRIILTMI